MTTTAEENQGFIDCWSNILTPKWIRFRHLLSGNGKIHSDVALPRFGVRAGNSVLDIACGFGESSLELGRIVGPTGKVVGVDCTQAFLDIANRERLVGPSGEIVREAGAEGQRRLPEIRERLGALMRTHLRDDGVYLPSSTWMIAARKPA